ncbi:MAG TPA: hypothetical protein VG013_14490 [Gemmataceae bacterium]|jgi:hypothetical protein|nr:hypothetical protein [Gemmataceae bacterium]
MKQILPYALWLGPGEGDNHFRQVFDAGIRALVYVAMEDSPPMPPREIICCRFPLLDGTGNRPDLLFLSVNTVATLLKLHIPTMVCCGSGASRSPAIAAAALAMVHQEPPEECLKRVVEHYPSDISPGFWSDVTGLLPAMR